MPKAIEGINWDGLKMAYLQGQGTLRELAERFGVPLTAVETRASRKGWKAARDKIEQGNDRALATISQKVTEKVAQKAADAVGEHLASVLTSGNGVLAKLQSKLLSAILPDITRLDHLESATRSYRSWDDLIRRAHGLADPTQRVDITTGGLPMHEKALSILESCTKLVSEGKVSSKTIDGEALLVELQADAHGVGDAVDAASDAASTSVGDAPLQPDDSAKSL